MKTRVIESLKLRPNMQADEMLLDDLYTDAESDVLAFINSDKLPEGIENIMKDLISWRFNTLGAEGLKSESPSGVGTSYDTDIPPRIKSILRRYRKLGGTSVSK